MDLFRYMESFQDSISGQVVGRRGDNLVVPANCLDKCALTHSHPPKRNECLVRNDA